MTIDHVEGAILAGGASTRMGRDKARVEWDGVPLVQRVHASLSACLTRVRVVIRPGDEAPAEIERIDDTHPARAPMVGVHAALAACERDAVLVMACDLPEVEPRLLLALLALVPVEDRYDVIAPRRADRFEPLCAVYRPRLLPELARRIEADDMSLQRLLEDVNTLAVPEAELRRLDPELRSFRNVNRPEDLVR